MHDWYVYLLLVVFGAAIGYLTKLVAIQMLFRPPVFVGIRPAFGLQGTVPRNAERVTRVSAELLATRLLEPRDVFARIDPAALAAQLEQPVLAAIDEIVRDVLRVEHPQAWELLPVLAQDVIVKQAQSAAPRLVEKVVAELRAEAGTALGTQALAAAFLRDPDLVPQVIRELSRPELTFVARFGLWSGLVLGVIQAVGWGLIGAGWVLPVAGAVIGGVTNAVALSLVFFPRTPRRMLGVVVQGAFPRRRAQVAVRYGEVLARDVITVRALVDAVLRGPQAAKVAAAIGRAVDEVVDEQPRITRLARLPELKRAATAAAVRRLPDLIRPGEPYLTSAIDLARTITSRVRKLNPVEYEALLRPAFRSHTWPLIAAGALIGAVIGTATTLFV